MSMLDAINPQFYRMGSGREEPDGSVSFLVRFVGREQGITGELFVRFEEVRPRPDPEPVAVEEEIDSEENASDEQAVIPPPPPPPPPPQNITIQKKWLFEDLILEEARSREEENREDRHRFDFSPYERIF